MTPYSLALTLEKIIIHTNSSKTHRGVIISQNGKPIVFYSRKITPAQINYTATEIELLSIVETLKELCTIILGHRITLYMYRKNITFENFTTEIVLHWRLMLEEYGPEIKYIKRPDNDTADALSRLLLINSDVTDSDITR